MDIPHTANIDKLNKLCLHLHKVKLSVFIKHQYQDLFLGSSAYPKDQFFIDIIAATHLDLYDSYLKQWSQDLRFQHRKDRRDLYTYLRDLIQGRLLEDMICTFMCDQGIPMILTGADHQREILVSPTGHHDLCIQTSMYGDIKIELLSDYHQYRSRYRRIDLRDHKYHHIKHGGYRLLGIDMTSQQCIYLPPHLLTQATYHPHHLAWGSKPVYSIVYDPQMVSSLTEVVQSLAKFCRSNS